MTAKRDWIVAAPAVVILGVFLIAMGYTVARQKTPTPQDLWLTNMSERCKVMGGRLTTTVADKMVAECYRHVFWSKSTNRLFVEEYNDRVSKR